MDDNCGAAITNLGELKQAALAKRSVIVPRTNCFNKPIPAAFILNMQGGGIYSLLRTGIFIYEKGNK